MFNEKGEKIGVKFDGYCAGYLVGVLETLIATDSKVCRKETWSDLDFLFSIYETYMNEKGIKDSEEASKTIIDALKRVFTCE